MTKITVFLLLTLSVDCFAGAKDSFIKKVMSECKKTRDEAEKVATGGRQGNIMKLRTCNDQTYTVKEINCSIQCSTDGAKIGE